MNLGSEFLSFAWCGCFYQCETYVVKVHSLVFKGKACLAPLSVVLSVFIPIKFLGAVNDSQSPNNSSNATLNSLTSPC